MESRIDRENSAVVQRRPERRWSVRTRSPSSGPCTGCASCRRWPNAGRVTRRGLGLPPDALLGVGVDRLDYTKGIEERLQAVDVLLERYPEFRGVFTFVQLAAPSRTKIARYQELNERVGQVAAAVNDRWGEDRISAGDPASRASRAAHCVPVLSGGGPVLREQPPRRDESGGQGVRRRPRGRAGVLVLSQFTGAARDLTEALIVNPYDMRQASDALATALRMPVEEQRVRMRRCESSSPSSTCTAGPAACWWTRRRSGGVSGCRDCCRACRSSPSSTRDRLMRLIIGHVDR